MTGNVLRALWTEPRVPDAPARVWRDWLVIAALVIASALENVLRPDIPWRPVGILQLAAVAVALLWRRTYPLPMLALGFGAAIAGDVASIIADAGGTVSLYSMGFLLILPYALFRWGSGREAVLGSLVALTAAAVSFARDPASLPEGLIGLVILVFPAVLGASVRFMTDSRVRELDQVRLRERELLARELHDTVAHHVSAMVIRAQAGRVVEQTRPGAAMEALEVIEAEGSRTLAEMRSMVGALRDRDEAELAPQTGIDDIGQLAGSPGDEPLVQVHLSGDLDQVSPPVGAAIYRIAQESVTNALRHARHATRVDVRVGSDGDVVRLTVLDDGDPVSAAWIPSGYGVVGMTERATLLGGTLEVGPGTDRGWLVTAVLPRAGATP